MEISGASTGIMVLVAAALWFAYLVPTWVRRREYLATERNATRLQQTLRVMAETAETPQEVRAEVTTRNAAETARLLQAAEKQRERERKAREAAALAELAARRDPLVTRVEDQRRRARRTRMGATIVLLAGIAAGGIQTVAMLTAGATTASWVVLAVAGLAVSLSLGTHRRLSRRRSMPVSVAPVAEKPVTRTRTAAPRREAPVAEQRTEWTPVPVPKPLYLSRPEHQSVTPTADAERTMREAAAAAEKALRAAHAQPEIVPFPSRSVAEAPAERPADRPAASEPRTASAPSAAPSASPPAPVPSKWASMGIVDAAPAGTPDLDEVLRRRRAAG
jgi:hypothetical protein